MDDQLRYLLSELIAFPIMRCGLIGVVEGFAFAIKQLSQGML